MSESTQVGKAGAGWFASVQSGEGQKTFLSFLYLYLLMTGYYILKPIRDALGLELGTKELPSLFLAGMVVIYIANMAYGWLIARWPREKFIEKL